MRELSEKILKDFQIRKNKKQKAAFCALISPVLQASGYDISVETSGLIKSRNIVIGDVKTAKLILTAHYDTCAQLPFPNYIFPEKICICMIIQFLMVAVIIGLYFLVRIFAYAVTGDIVFALIAGLAVYVVCLFMLLAGKANIHNSNDNTSGVITLLETALSLSPESAKNVVFVFFDNEELGMLGSSRFAKMHKNDIKGKALMNFDCVSDGDMILLMPDRYFKNDHRMMDALFASFSGSDDKQVRISEKKLFYPSDQMMFKKTVGVASMKQSKHFGLYLDRIHTVNDTVFDERNITLIKSSLINMINLISSY